MTNKKCIFVFGGLMTNSLYMEERRCLYGALERRMQQPGHKSYFHKHYAG